MHDNHFTDVFVSGKPGSANGILFNSGLNGVVGGNRWDSTTILSMGGDCMLVENSGMSEQFFGTMIADSCGGNGVHLYGGTSRFFFENLWASTNGGSGFYCNGASSGAAVTDIQIGSFYAHNNAGTAGFFLDGYTGRVQVGSLNSNNQAGGYGVIFQKHTTNFMIGLLTTYGNGIGIYDGGDSTSNNIYVRSFSSTDTVKSSLSSATNVFIATNLATSDVTGVLPVSNGGTNSGTTLANGNLMVSAGGAIVEGTSSTTPTFTSSGANGMTVNVVSSGSAYPVTANNQALGSNVFTAYQIAGVMKSRVGWKTGVGIMIYDQVNSQPWLSQGTGVLGYVASYNNILDDGNGGMMVSATNASMPLRTNAGKFLVSGPTNLASVYNPNTYTGDVTGILPVSNGGTNSGTALVGGNLMVSVGGAIVEGTSSSTPVFATVGVSSQLTTHELYIKCRFIGNMVCPNTNTLTSGTATQLLFTSGSFNDAQGLYNGGTTSAASSWTIQVAGRWSFHVSVHLQSHTTGATDTTGILLYAGGQSGTLIDQINCQPDGMGNRYCTLKTSYLMNLNDVVTVWAYQASGSTLYAISANIDILWVSPT